VLNHLIIVDNTFEIKCNPIVRVVSTQFDINGSNQISKFQMTIQLNEYVDVPKSPGQPFGAGLALQN